MYWQGISRVMSCRATNRSRNIWREVPRRATLAFLLAPLALIPDSRVCLISLRWRRAYAWGFVRAAMTRSRIANRALDREDKLPGLGLPLMSRSAS